jgi:hypothetical protein
MRVAWLCTFTSLVISSRVQDPFNALRPGRAPSFLVSFKDTPGAVIDESAVSTSYDMVDDTGLEWRCRVPTADRVREDDNAVEESIEVMRARDALRRLDGSAKGACAQRRFDFWTYTVCANGSVVQSHQGSDGVVIKNSLGELESSSDDVGVLPSGGLFFEQHFSHGTDERNARVRWICSETEDGLPSSSSVDTATAAAAPDYVTLRIDDVSETKLAYSLVIAVRDADLCRALPSPRSLLLALNGTCIEHHTGTWWTYEVCLGRNVRQFHGPSSNPVQETLLGTYDWEFGERIIGSGISTGAEDKSKGIAGMSSRTAAALAQLYEHGAPCDVRGGTPRRTAVLFECTPTSGGRVSKGIDASSHSITLISIVEAPTCGAISARARLVQSNPPPD